MDDAFDTVAVTWSQPEAAVMLSFLAWHDIPAYALREHARVAALHVTALGGIPIRVHRPALTEARALLAEVPGPAIICPALIGNRLANVVLLLFAFMLGGTPPPRTRSIVI